MGGSLWYVTFLALAWRIARESDVSWLGVFTVCTKFESQNSKQCKRPVVFVAVLDNTSRHSCPHRHEHPNTTYSYYRQDIARTTDWIVLFPFSYLSPRPPLIGRPPRCGREC